MGLREHLEAFPPRIKRALMAFRDWDGVCEIRLRREKPLSLTHFGGNLFLDAKGRVTSQDGALSCSEEEIRQYVGVFCGGSVYRYFDTLKEGFVVDEEGYRLGICPEKNTSTFLPERFEGINLRIPRVIPSAAKSFLEAFGGNVPKSTLILSPPGEGKTTLLRALAADLSKGRGIPSPLRTVVVDARREIFPEAFQSELGLCDVLGGYEKGEGILIATRLFSPQAILCDEIASDEEARAVLMASGGGPLFFATAHAGSIREAKSRPFLKLLLENGVFGNIALLRRLSGKEYKSEIFLEEI